MSSDGLVALIAEALRTWWGGECSDQAEMEIAEQSVIVAAALAPKVVARDALERVGSLMSSRLHEVDADCERGPCVPVYRIVESTE